MIVRYQARINQLLHQPGSSIGQKLYALGLNVESQAKRNCPVNTGRLRSSITTTQPREEHNGLTVRVGSDVKYALFVHQGTARKRGRPFLTDALNQQVR